MCGICFGIRSTSSTHSSLDSLTLEDSSPIVSTFNGPNSNGIAESVGESKRLEKKYLNSDQTWETIVEAVKPRGPDYHGSFIKEIIVKEDKFKLKFHASILHMRGDELTKQPFISDNGDVLLWNGEIFEGLEIGPTENDGQKLFNLLLSEGSSNFFSAIRLIEGPYAFIFYQSSTNLIYFARDPLGRRSLLLHKPTNASPYFYLSSNAPAIDFDLCDWQEVECDSIHCIDLKKFNGEQIDFDIERSILSFPRYSKSTAPTPDSLIYPFNRLLSTLPELNDLLPLDSELQPTISTPSFESTLQTFLSILESSVSARISTIPLFPPPPHARIAILFSGGIDCTLLAMMTDKVLAPGERIDLINVSFENPRKIQGNLNVKLDEAKKLKKKSRSKMSKSEKNDKWNNKVKRREGEVEGNLEDGEDNEKVEASKVEELEPSIPIIPPPPLNQSNSIYDGPDRITGRATLEELRELRPDRDWNFIEVDVTYQEMLEGKKKVVELLRPHCTVMDLSIAIAFFFAARGSGHIKNPIVDLNNPTIPYQSNARVLFSGLGADELLGGYARHRRAYYKSPVGDWNSLIAELQMDLDRISVRNLGRDDRIISFHGKEARYPFLAGKFVDFISSIPVWLKLDPRGKEGLGDKLLLRQAARSLGLGCASGLKKRAIHFGAGTAKMELDSGKDKGDFIIS